MSTRTTVLLTSPLAPDAGRLALRRALERFGPVADPTWGLDPAASDLLARPSALLRRALADLTGPAVLCGVGGGVPVALRLAADAPAQVSGLVLATGRRPTGRVLVRSVHRAVADLLPLPALQRLHADERALLHVLDRVRARDVEELAAGVAQPALVAWGRRDPVDRRSAQGLVAALANGRLETVADAGPGWVWRTPDRLAALVPALD